MIQSHHHKRLTVYASIAAGVLLLAGLGFGVYRFILTNRALKETQHKLMTSLESIATLEKQNEELGGTLSETAKKKEELDVALKQQQENNESLKDRNNNLQEERNLYEKIAKTDKQLLAKYSKVYFLNENYSPIKLTDINTMYTLPVGKTLQFLDPAYKYLEDLLKDAEKDGISLRIASAYRSFETQASLKSNYKVTYGSGANTFSADQGYSEHQLGTTVDFTTPELVGAVQAFANTAANKWLLENAYKFGFVLSYPKSNAYYIYEPWHWRFVGVDLAKGLHENGKNFYDLDQRAIDEYLIKIFD